MKISDPNKYLLGLNVFFMIFCKIPIFRNYKILFLDASAKNNSNKFSIEFYTKALIQSASES